MTEATWSRRNGGIPHGNQPWTLQPHDSQRFLVSRLRLLPPLRNSTIGNAARRVTLGEQDDAEEGSERGQGENPDAPLPALLEAVAPSNDGSPSVPGLQVAELEHATRDAHPTA